MLFDYEVMNKEDALAARYQLMKAGDYDAVIKSAKADVSPANNNMYVVEVDVYDSKGKPHSIKDYLTFTPQMMWKLIHCAESAGLMKEYESKKLSTEVLINKRVRVKIAIKKGGEIPFEKLGDREPGSTYPDKNVIGDYLPRNVVQREKEIDDLDAMFNDPVPSF